MRITLFKRIEIHSCADMVFTHNTTMKDDLSEILITSNKKNMKTEKKYMQTMVSCLKDLQKQGFETSFKVTVDGLLSLTTKNLFSAGQLSIVHYSRFEGESNPDDNSIIYAIETNTGEKGVLVNGYGISSDPQIDSFMQQVQDIHK